jgi:ABC-type nitrate/sulfonate/bicarbonate transport system substrate-binding protein
MADQADFRACSSAVVSGSLMRCGAAEAAAEAVRISYPTSGSAGTIWRSLIARHGTNGLNLNWIGANPGQGQIQLAAGTLDVAFYGAIGLAQTVSHGSDLVLFGPALNNHGRWIVRDDSPFRSPRDLIGKRIATQSESSETFLQARMASLTQGLDLKRDFQIFFGPPTANVALFERGDVDAVIALEPTATRLVGRGARQIASVGDIWREGTGDDTPLFLVGFAAKRDFIAANRQPSSICSATSMTKCAAIPRVLLNCIRKWGYPAPKPKPSRCFHSGFATSTRPTGGRRCSPTSIARSISQ